MRTRLRTGKGQRGGTTRLRRPSQRKRTDFAANNSRSAEQLLKDFPKNFEALRIMGFVYSGHGDREKMVQCWRQCVELQPNRADVHDQLGRYEFQNQAYEAAIEHWQRVLAIDAKFPGAHRQIGEALLQLGKPEDANTYLQLAIEIAPNDSEAHYFAGRSALPAPRLASKPSRITPGQSELQPTHKQAYYGLIKTCGQLGERDEVAEYSQKFQQLQSAIVRSRSGIPRAL